MKKSGNHLPPTLEPRIGKFQSVLSRAARISLRTLLIALSAPAIGWSEPLPAAQPAAPAASPATEPSKAAIKVPASTRTPQIGAEGRPAVIAYRMHHYVAGNMKIGDGFVDGGRGMKMQKDDRVSSGREILTVDRKRDPELQKQIAFARSPELEKLNPLDRATRLARHVAWVYTPKDGTKHLEAKCAPLEKEHRNHEVLIGDVAKITDGAGVCRHRSLMFKLLADEAGLNVALVRGCWAHRTGKQGGHAWNELQLPDGRVLIVDTMNHERNFQFPDTNSKHAARYFTVDHKPKYPAVTKPAPATGEK